MFHSFCSLVSHFALLALELGLLFAMIVVIGSGSAASAVATTSASIMTELFDSVGLRPYRDFDKSSRIKLFTIVKI